MDTQLNKIITTIVDYIHPNKIILFGSRARGSALPDSDYDLAIIYDGDKSNREVKVGVRKRFKPPIFDVDLFVLNSTELERFKHVANTLEREITESGIVVYGQ